MVQYVIALFLTLWIVTLKQIQILLFLFISREKPLPGIKLRSPILKHLCYQWVRPLWQSLLLSELCKKFEFKRSWLKQNASKTTHYKTRWFHFQQWEEKYQNSFILRHGLQIALYRFDLENISLEELNKSWLIGLFKIKVKYTSSLVLGAVIWK